MFQWQVISSILCWSTLHYNRDREETILKYCLSIIKEIDNEIPCLWIYVSIILSSLLRDEITEIQLITTHPTIAKPFLLHFVHSASAKPESHRQVSTHHLFYWELRMVLAKRLAQTLKEHRGPDFSTCPCFSETCSYIWLKVNWSIIHIKDLFT